MPVYHVIAHGFFTWNADNPEGYYRRNRGRYAPEVKLAKHWTRTARFPVVYWHREDQEILLHAVLESARRRNWEIYAVATQTTHLHIIVAWQTQDSPNKVQQTLKQIMSLQMGRTYGYGRRWLARNGQPQRVKNGAHLRHLLYGYLPSQAIIFWRRDIPQLCDRLRD